ncbi:hypothetical protein MTE01_16740 [Microbacterium testaceum]|uniref:Uncharacterized protein n=2 Tax=Microbacterium testaceum TaxID=2033 RepID=A0A4Y3QLA6_MICTE|nr:hypothetical protein MTE01_16740 [Microbacterium testaceum]
MGRAAEPNHVPGSPASGALWAEVEWVPAGERRRLKIVMAGTLGLMIVGIAVHLTGMVLARTGAGVPLMLVGIALVALALPVAVFVNSYRGITPGTPGPPQLFHLSPIKWEPQDIVTLEASRSRGRQFFVDHGKLRRQYKRMVFFFPQRPTSKHMGQQSLKSKKGQLYLYELEPLTPLGPQYQRGAALGIPHDVTVRVLNRQPLPLTARSRLRRRGR